MVSEHASPLAVLGGVDAGGQNVHVAALATALAKRGHEVVVFTRRDDPDLPERVPLCRGVVVEHVTAGPAVPIPKDELLPHIPALGDGIAARLRRRPASVLHAHFWMSGLAALRARADCDVPVVQTFHALGTVKRRFQREADTSPRSRIALEKHVARDAARVLASCTDEARELAAMGTPRSHIDIVPSGVDIDLFRPKGPVAERSGRHRLLAVGRLVERKGVADAIAAVRRLPEVELLIAGGPHRAALDADPEAVRLARLADEYGVADRVRLIGRVTHEDLPALLRSADAVVCLPWYEPFGIVPLEAMACGVPVVGSAVGGLLDTVIDGVTGVLLPPRDADAAADALARLLADDGARRAMGRAGAERVRAHYTWDRVAASVERSYLRSMAGTGRRTRTAEQVG
jgi:glycosyltransferase involved in cell wall biosynthesis